eukprot:GEMP01044928.1.p2 GENE.GEMP01044928.1~~GEMP01044928.1.p2  ORF type:complete len:171 (+),score=52.10 GEMP01044928.1:25-537(+)
MDAAAKTKAKAKADAAFAKAVAAKTAAYVKAGFPAPPPLQNLCGICGAPPAQGAAAPPHGAAAPPQAAAAQAMAAPAAPGWRERSKINHAKASAWPPGVDFQTVVHPRFLELNTALDQTWHAIKATNKRMKIIREDHDARSRPNTIPELVANAMDHLDDTAAGAFGAIVP